MASLFRNSVIRDGKRIIYPTWYGSFRNEHGRWEKVQLFTDKTASGRRLNEIQRDADLRRAGVLTPMMDHAAKSIDTHRDDYLADLRGQNVSAQHLKNVETRINEIITLGGWKRLSDITADGMRGVLNAVGKRQASGTKIKQGLTLSTVNSFLKMARAFVHWLVQRGRLNGDPLAVLKKADESRAEKRRARRSLSGDEIIRLLEAAPPDRSFVYKFIILSGLRRGEARQLRVGDLHLAATLPFIQLRTEQTKNGKADQIPVHPELLAELIERTSKKLPAANLFHAIPEVRTLMKDLAKAKIEFVNDTNQRVDLHAQRHTFCTLIARSGASMKTAQTLMRHGDPKLTMNVYSHVGIFDTASALASVTLPTAVPVANVKTGTADVPVEPADASTEDSRWKIVRKTPVAKGHNMSPHVTSASERPGSLLSDAPTFAPLETSGSVANSHGMSPHGLNLFPPADMLESIGPRSSVG